MSFAERELLQHVAALDTAAADVRRQLRAAASALCRARRCERRGPYNARARYIAVAVTELSGGDASMAACFLATRCAPHPSARELGADGLEALVRSWHGTFDQDALAEMHTETPSSRAPWHRAARDFVAQARAATWVFEQNTRKGFAPPSRMVQERLRAEARSVAEPAGQRPAPAHARPASAEPPTQGSAGRMRVCRWRIRWRASLSRVRAREHVDEAEITSKASFAGPKKDP